MHLSVLTLNFIYLLWCCRPAPKIVDSVTGGLNEDRGTWIHLKLVNKLAAWISDEFAILAGDWVDRLMRGDPTMIGVARDMYDLANGTKTTVLMDTAPAGGRDEVSELQVAAVRAELLLRIDQLGVERARVLVEKRKLELELEEVDVRRRRTAAGWRVEATDYRRQHLEKLAELQRTVEGNGTLRLNDRDRLFLQDKVNDALYSDVDAPREDAPPRKSLDITTVAREMGYAVHCKEAALVGRSMAARFRERFPDVPIPKAEKFVDGAVRMVNCYWDTPEVRALMEGCIREFVEEAGKRPVQSRRA